MTACPKGETWNDKDMPSSVWRKLAWYPGLPGLVAVLLHFGVHLGWGLAMFAIFVAWPVLGTIITIDDDLPGGWSNPDGHPVSWRALFPWDAIATGCAISALAWAVESGFSDGWSAGLIAAVLALGTLATLLLRRILPQMD
jgi:hypothetical protein